MGLYNSLFTITKQICNDYNLKINLGLCNIISILIGNNNIISDDLFSIKINENYCMNITNNINIFDKSLFNMIENNIVSKLNEMMEKNNKIKIVGASDNIDLKIDSLLILHIDSEIICENNAEYMSSESDQSEINI